jgi:hypothetical protein
VRSKCWAHARLEDAKARQQRQEPAVFSTDNNELWRDGGVGLVQKHRALRLVEHAATAACADWGTEY